MKPSKQVAKKLKALKDKFPKSRGKGNVHFETQIFNHARGETQKSDGKN